jgi:hypothetical protein
MSIALPARALIPQLPYYRLRSTPPVISYVAGLALVAAIAASIAPALEALKKDVSASLHDHDALPGAIGWSTRDVLMAAQVGICLVMLFAAGVFLHAEVLWCANNIALNQRAQAARDSSRYSW